MQDTLSFGVPFWEPLRNLINFFADEEGDKTQENEEDFEDDLEDAFGGDEEEFEEEDDAEQKDKEKDTEKDKKDTEKDKKQDSAVIQKQKYREKLKDALSRIKELETQKDTQGTLTDEEKKEKAANEFLAQKIKEVLEDIKKTEEKAMSEAEEAFQEEIDAVLEEHTDLTEKEILDVCEELDVSPTQAVKIIERERKLKGKEKPKLPQPKRGNPKVEEDDIQKDKKFPTLDEINRELKKKIQKGIL